jgi:ATP-dependent Clp protease ATP-binding subunit ClpA
MAMLERFSSDAREIVAAANEEARLMRHRRVGTEHLLVALAGEPEVAALGLGRETARAEVVRTVGLGDAVSDPGERVPFTPAAQDALEAALGEAMRLGHGQIRPGHVLLAVLRQRDGVARRLLVAAGAVPSELREAIATRLAKPQPTQPEGPLANIGQPQADLRLLLTILERGGPVAAWLRERGVDEPTLRRMLSA